MGRGMDCIKEFSFWYGFIAFSRVVIFVLDWFSAALPTPPVPMSPFLVYQCLNLCEIKWTFESVECVVWTSEGV